MAQHLSFSSAGKKLRVFAEELAPAPGGGQAPKPAILLLHGSGGNVDFWASQLAPVLSAAGVHVYAPHYFDQTGTQRATPAMFTDGVHVPQWLAAVGNSLEFVASRPAVDARRIAVVGISLGAFLAMAVSAQQSAGQAPSLPKLRAVIEVSGGLVEPYASLATSHLAPTLLVHGTADTVVPVSFAEELAARLQALGVPHRTELLNGEGHWFSAKAWPRLLVAVSQFLAPLLHNQ